MRKPQFLHYGSQCVLVTVSGAHFLTGNDALANDSGEHQALPVGVAIVEGNKQYAISAKLEIWAIEKRPNIGFKPLIGGGNAAIVSVI